MFFFNVDSRGLLTSGSIELGGVRMGRRREDVLDVRTPSVLFPMIFARIIIEFEHYYCEYNIDYTSASRPMTIFCYKDTVCGT